MSINYARLQATAARLLSENGQSITLTRSVTNPDNYDPATGDVMAFTLTQTGFGVVFEYNTFIRSGVRDEPGSLIVAGDKQLILTPLKADGTALNPPKVGDRATLASGVAYTVTAVAPLSPAGTASYYECNIRGSA
jgi:hypothetical protein